MKDLRLFSWNINGIRAAIKKNALQDFLAQETPDILCLQEVKAKPEQIDFDFSGLFESINLPSKREIKRIRNRINL